MNAVEEFKETLITHCKSVRNKCYTFACPFYNGKECVIEELSKQQFNQKDKPSD